MDNLLSKQKKRTTSTKVKKIILNITPQTHVRATSGDRILFRIPRSVLRPQGLARLLRLEKYNEYKINLLAEAKKKKFEIPVAGLDVTFYMPCPKTWSKKKKKQLHGSYCMSRPDIDNLFKAFGDSLCVEDKHIASVKISKRWVDFPSGWIECSLLQPIYKEDVLFPVKEAKS